MKLVQCSLEQPGSVVLYNQILVFAFLSQHYLNVKLAIHKVSDYEIIKGGGDEASIRIFCQSIYVTVKLAANPRKKY